MCHLPAICHRLVLARRGRRSSPAGAVLAALRRRLRLRCRPGGTSYSGDMTVGQYAGIPLQEPSDQSHHGGIFLLRKAPDADSSVSIAGWTTRVQRGTNVVVVFGPAGTSDAASTYSAAIAAANIGLDYMSARGAADLVIESDLDNHIVWWTEEGHGVVMEATAVHTFQFSMSVTVEARDTDGNLIPPQPITPIQHDALRFIRMSRTSIYL
jgi:hypothetical protein